MAPLLPCHQPVPQPGGSRWSWRRGGGEAVALSLPQKRLPSPLPSPLPPEACGCPVGGRPPPPQRAGQQPSSFHQLIIFTNLQACKKVHSGPNSLGQEPCGKAEARRPGTGRLGQRPLPAAARVSPRDPGSATAPAGLGERLPCEGPPEAPALSWLCGCGGVWWRPQAPTSRRELRRPPLSCRARAFAVLFLLPEYPS